LPFVSTSIEKLQSPAGRPADAPSHYAKGMVKGASAALVSRETRAGWLRAGKDDAGDLTER
jgi:hypothetical protein